MLVEILRLVPKGIRRPRRPISAPLKLDLVPRFRHHREQPIRVGDTKWIERPDRPSEHRHAREECEDTRIEQDAKDDRFRASCPARSLPNEYGYRLRDVQPHPRANLIVEQQPP